MSGLDGLGWPTEPIEDEIMSEKSDTEKRSIGHTGNCRNPKCRGNCESDTPRHLAIKHNIYIAMRADNSEQSIAHLEEAHREIESMDEELAAARAEIELYKSDLKEERGYKMEYKQQRDRLAEVMLNISLISNSNKTNSIIAEALQSLTTNASI